LEAAVNVPRLHIQSAYKCSLSHLEIAYKLEDKIDYCVFDFKYLHAAFLTAVKYWSLCTEAKKGRKRS